MSRRPASDVLVSHTIEGTQFKLATSTLTHLPDAPAFIRVLLRRGISTHVAGEYARLAAKVIRSGRAGIPEQIAQRTDRTAINAYWTWVGEAYTERVRPIIRAFADDDVRKGVSWLRVGSIVPPRPGKTIPRLVRMPQLQLDPETHAAVSIPGEVGWVETSAWTLHVPHGPCAVHTDPCLDCTPLELDPVKLEVIAAGFEAAWGHRNIERVPPECFLFGTPPLEGLKAARDAFPAGKIVALLSPGVLSDTVTQLQGYVSREEDAFMSRLTEGEVDVVIISRERAGKHYARLLHDVRQAWDRDTAAVREAAEDSIVVAPGGEVEA